MINVQDIDTDGWYSWLKRMAVITIGIAILMGAGIGFAAHALLP